MRGKAIVVTGGFGVLGRAVAEAAHARGAKTAVVDYVGGEPPAGVAGFGGVDVTDASSAQKAMDAAAAKLGGIDALINVAGGFRWETVEGGSMETWDLLYKLNVKTAVTAAKAALPHILNSKAGRIVNVGANGALKSGAGMGAYAASKSGVHRFTESLAEELKARGVTVNAVLPSIIDTPANRADMPDADFSTWVSPADLAATILFLVSDEAKSITGALIPVTGRV